MILDELRFVGFPSTHRVFAKKKIKTKQTKKQTNILQFFAPWRSPFSTSELLTFVDSLYKLDSCTIADFA